jgi:hypothetical protein
VSHDHLSFDELAELDEGLLSPERAAEVRALLAECPDCRERADAIAATKTTLAELRVEPMPDAIKARIDRALAGAAPKTDSVVPDLSAYRARRFGMPMIGASIAAVVVTLAIVVVVVGHYQSNNGELGSTSAAGGSGAATAREPSVAVPQPNDYVRASTNSNYSPTQLQADIPGLVAKLPVATSIYGSLENGPAASPSSTTAPQSTPVSPSSVARHRVPANLRPLYNSRAKLLACARVVSGIPNAVPLAVDFGRWSNGAIHNVPAIVMIFRDANPEQVDVYVTDPTCSGTGQIYAYVKVPLR